LLHPGDVSWVGAGQVRVRPLLRVERLDRARVEELSNQFVPLAVRPVAPDDPVRRGEGCDLADPGEQACVTRRSVEVVGHGCHEPLLWSALTNLRTPGRPLPPAENYTGPARGRTGMAPA